MDSKFLISGDGIGWTLAKPAILAVAVFGGMGGQAVPSAKPLTPRPAPPAQPSNALASSPRPFNPQPVVQPDMAASAGATSLAGIIASPAGITARRAGIMASHAGTIASLLPRPNSAARMEAAFPRSAQPPLSASVSASVPVADLAIQARPASAATEAVQFRPTAQTMITTWGEAFPTLQQAVAPASAQTVPSAELTSLHPALSPELSPAAVAAVLPALATGPDESVRFVSVPVVQALPPSAAAKPERTLGAPLAQPVPSTKSDRLTSPSQTSARLTPAPKTLSPAAPARTDLLASARTAPSRAAPLAAPLAKTPKARLFASPSLHGASTTPKGPAHALQGDAILFSLTALVNGAESGTIGLRVTPDDRLWLRLGDLLQIVKSRMAPADFERMSAASSMADYVEFDTVRRAGIDLRYDAAHNRIALGTQ